MPVFTETPATDIISTPTTTVLQAYNQHLPAYWDVTDTILQVWQQAISIEATWTSATSLQILTEGAAATWQWSDVTIITPIYPSIGNILRLPSLPPGAPTEVVLKR